MFERYGEELGGLLLYGDVSEELLMFVVMVLDWKVDVLVDLGEGDR